MNFFIQLITVCRIFLRRLKDTARSYYWKIELRRRGAKIGKGIIIKHGAEISVSRTGHLVMGNNVYIAENARIFVGPNASLRLDSNVFLGVNSVIASRSMISVGDKTQIAHNVTIIDHDHDFHTHAELGNKAPIEIGKNVWIAANAIVLKGVVIENASVIGAGAIVTKRVPSNSISLGKSAENKPLEHATL